MDLLIRAALRHGSGGRDLHGWTGAGSASGSAAMSVAPRPNTPTAREMFFTVCLGVGEGERQLVPDLVIRGAGDAQTTRLAERFEARRNVHAVAEDVIAVDDDVADVDADPKNDPLVFG